MFARLMGLKTVAPKQLHQLMKEQDVTVIDVNSPASWRKLRVPGALNLDPGGFRRDELPTVTDTTLVFYCSNPLCRKAPIAARRAKKMNFANLFVMSAGIKGWQDAELPTENGDEA